MPITGQGWELHVVRKREQRRDGKRRTVGSYRIFHDGQLATGTVSVDGNAVPLSGTTAESPGPSQNAIPATAAKPSRILPGRYPLKTSGGPTYVTNGFRQDTKIKAQMPGIELRKTGNRSDIIVHPGKDEFLSSIGCINPCTALPKPSENIDFPGSRRRVIAMIEDMKAFLGSVPGDGDAAILNAFVVIDEEFETGPMAVAASGTIDGRAVAAKHGVMVKNASVNLAKLHPAMEKVIASVAAASEKMGLPTPVITSGNDSSHKQGSMHFRNRALDFRGNNISLAQGRAWRVEVVQRLGADYDVLFEEFANKANNHLHVEFDPD